MTDDVRAIVEGLTAGAKRACLKMTDDWQFCGKRTFDPNGAHALHWARCGGPGILTEYSWRPDKGGLRAAYRLTPLGLRVRNHLLGASND